MSPKQSKAIRLGEKRDSNMHWHFPHISSDLKSGTTASVVFQEAPQSCLNIFSTSRWFRITWALLIQSRGIVTPISCIFHFFVVKLDGYAWGGSHFESFFELWSVNSSRDFIGRSTALRWTLAGRQSYPYLNLNLRMDHKDIIWCHSAAFRIPSNHLVDTGGKFVIPGSRYQREKANTGIWV